ncbi:MAG: ABC transporter transmembrane domain-containing protein [Pyrinomonadaceae bacterium]
MTIWQIIRRRAPFVRPYRRWVIFSLVLTLLGAFAAQVNPIVLRYTVDTIERLLREGRTATEGASLLLLISAILFGKEILNTGLRYGQNLFGEKIRVNVSSRLSQFAVERILKYQLAFYADKDNQTGILQTRMDRGAESLTKSYRVRSSISCRCSPTPSWRSSSCLLPTFMSGWWPRRSCQSIFY